jgi:uncharacterized membrane protein
VRRRSQSEPPDAGGHVADIVTGRGFDRLVNFTDAVVAIAVTVLVLPLTALTRVGDGQTVWDLIGDNSGPVTSFFFTFVVVAIMWGVHNRVVNGMRGYDGTIFWLNVGWIAAIAFLPWPAGLYGEEIGIGSTAVSEYSGGEGLGGVGLFYWCTLAAVSAFGSLMALHVRRHPELRLTSTVGMAAPDWRDRWRGLVFAAFFVAVGLVSIVAPVVASWMPLVIIPMSVLLRSAPEVVGADASVE